MPARRRPGYRPRAGLTPRVPAPRRAVRGGPGTRGEEPAARPHDAGSRLVARPRRPDAGRAGVEAVNPIRRRVGVDAGLVAGRRGRPEHPHRAPVRGVVELVGGPDRHARLHPSRQSPSPGCGRGVAAGRRRSTGRTAGPSPAAATPARALGPDTASRTPAFTSRSCHLRRPSRHYDPASCSLVHQTGSSPLGAAGIAALIPYLGAPERVTATNSAGVRRGQLRGLGQLVRMGGLLLVVRLYPLSSWPRLRTMFHDPRSPHRCDAVRVAGSPAGPPPAPGTGSAGDGPAVRRRVVPAPDRPAPRV
ncbi:hypothetical protein ETAA1_55450 [Urbifossiella limnaea]|uniref:Uncharacterized protein n=1 Tax=Urbifossiella limnaea TaxID=2528023 RepID=A0A517Y1B5_9BACT|nr:hypothetical protein ETAA1_55450 [Urbifossiella limnaea]